MSNNLPQSVTLSAANIKCEVRIGKASLRQRFNFAVAHLKAASLFSKNATTIEDAHAQVLNGPYSMKN